ncbi:unnamed protein product [Effrenium voratum]|nr:unnamed protein product [Effrenium voratum]
MEEEANYDDDEEAEPEDEEDDNAADEEAEQEVQPKQAKKRRRGKAGRGRGKPPAQDQEERRAAAETIGRSILTAKMKKTRMCDFHKEGRCKYGSDCAFAHDESELQKAPDLKKTRLCRAFLQRKCNDADCKFAHGEQELRGMATEVSRKRKLPAPAEDPGLGGLYDFLPPPDPEKDKATAAKARKTAELNTKPKLPPTDRTRVIFLDVDGVLLAAGSVEMIYIDGVMLPVRAAKEADFSRVALSNLRSIVQQTGATIVLSSEWRRREEMRDNIRRTLAAQDIPGFQDSTPIFQPSAELVKQRLDQAIIWAERRAREIGSWLKQHKEVKAWAVIDDIDFSWADSVKVQGTPLIKHRSVLTNPKHCITEKDADEAVRILLNPPVIAPGEEADAIAAARYLTDEALAKCAGGGLM